MKNIFNILILALVAGCSKSSPSSTAQADSLMPALKAAEQLYRDGRLDPARQALEAILHTGPRHQTVAENQEASYYLSLVWSSQMAGQKPPAVPRGYEQTIPQQPIY